LPRVRDFHPVAEEAFFAGGVFGDGFAYVVLGG